ncbi:hypothetical protein Pmar_PMAR010652 [Perkinsus marinus ATCC 50983]|uniref:Uncharacterized protein n=1 Tax=Perkinsus marinus (strain ATCC 50983 / TXsc) TaxID=423536 RepID=C5L4P2_PERM5|nr:hypothetical protein Pmar_PMAR010652 [Perkinsus marinus ATCC 50983]EER08310.1 hypothetical protein Pmar_PMAR010652 [Perkinsus marinus ATCC 50983]|eukprot:XP_002776494.1 hypothetical protein Pmar_PMAR010652 [Perkinsus marinus ATCC 50983]
MSLLPYPFSAAAVGSTSVSALAFVVPTLLYVLGLSMLAHAPFMEDVILHLASLDKLWSVFSIILGLLFGFYTTASFSRWWALRTLTAHAAGRSIDITVILTGEGMAEHLDLYRLLLLSYAIHLIELTGGRGEDRVEALEAMGLLKKSDTIARPLSVPAVYSCFLRNLAAIKDVPSHVRLSVQADLTVCRGCAGDSMMYLSTPVPPTLSWIVHGGTWAFLLFMPFGYVAPLANHDTHAVIVISSSIFIIMHTWLLTTDYVLNSTRGFNLNKFWLNTVATVESLVSQSIVEEAQRDKPPQPRRFSRRRPQDSKKDA